ncbi:MAG: TolC family protein [Proteobacteria bacterium]|nr:TolC family protein [Pseudomonadota bacterium]
MMRTNYLNLLVILSFSCEHSLFAADDADSHVNKLAGVTLPNGIRNPDEVSSASLVLTQTITAWFALDHKKAAEQHLAEAARADRVAGAQDLRARTAENFLRVLKSARLRDIAKQSVAVIQKQKEDAERLRAQGKLAQLDFARFAFAESESITQLSDVDAQLFIAAASLREQLNIPPNQELVLEDIKAPLPSEKSGNAQPRPELRSAQERADALQNFRSAARIDYLPSVNAFARYDRDFAAHDINIPIPGAPIYPKEDFRDRLSYGLSMNWLLWDGMSRQAHDREMSAEANRANFQIKALASNLRIEEAQSSAELEKSRQTLRNAEISAKLSEEIFNAFTAKFKNGLATTTDLLGAERDLTRAKAQLASTGYDLELAKIRYNRAHGSQI